MKTVEPPSPAPEERVVLVHGFLSHRVYMTPLGRRLRRSGYSVHNWSYPSTSGRLERLAERLRAELERRAAGAGRVHVVAYSLGALLVRLALAGESGEAGGVGRIVMIAPPNGGSPMARFFAPLLGWLLPALPRMSDAGSYVHRIPTPAGVEVGVIAGRWDFWSAPAALTHLDGEADHVCLQGTHLSLPLQKNVARQVHSFLSTGRFARQGAGYRRQ